MDEKLIRLRDLEGNFSANNYNGIIESKYIYKEGNIPILVSAPHSVRETSEKYLKVPDTLTGGIALLMSELTGCHVITKAQNDGIDPNHTNIGRDAGYKEKMIDVIKRENIVLVIDLHGLRSDRDTDIDIITNHSLTIGGDTKIIERLEDIMQANNILNLSRDKYYYAKSKKVIVHKIWNILEVPSVEIEINWHYRNFEEQNNLVMLLNSLEEFIIKYKGVL